MLSFNLLPVLLGNDGFAIIKTIFKTKKSMFIISIISIFIMIYLLSIIKTINIIFLSMIFINLIIMNIVMFHLDKKLNVDLTNDKRGLHFRKSGLMIYYKF